MDSKPTLPPTDLPLTRCLLRIFDAMNCGGILIASDRRIIDLNAEAKRHVGGGIEIKKDRLHAKDRASDTRLQSLLGDLLTGTAPPHRDALGISRGDRRPLLLRMVPVEPDGALGDTSVVAVLIDPEECPTPSYDLLRQLFGLSKSEAAVAVGIMCGKTLDEIATSAKKNVGTVRAQTKAVLTKTGARRQAELVGLLTRLAMISHNSK
jgi:DNA-binding CsgD family transcriptional regulator